MKKPDGLVLSVAELSVFIRDIVIVAGKRNSKIIIDKIKFTPNPYFIFQNKSQNISQDDEGIIAAIDKENYPFEIKHLFHRKNFKMKA